MFAFAPSSAHYDAPFLHGAQSHYQPSSYRDRYLAALAEARSAEAEYVASIAREKIQKQREEEIQKVILQKQREEALRRLLLDESLYSRIPVPNYPDDSYSVYTPTHHYPSQFDVEAQVAVQYELERRRAIIHHQQQEELAKRKRLAILRQQEQEREQAQALASAQYA